MSKRLVLAMLLPLVFAGGCAGLNTKYTTRAFEAWVVDADTGLPIEGAIVVANWQLVKGTLDGPPHDAQSLETKETVTDKNGRFHFAEVSLSNPTDFPLWDQDPKVVIFKPGYRYFVHVNQYRGAYWDGSLGAIRTSQLNGRSIKLTSAVAHDEVQGRLLNHLAIELAFAYRETGCIWQKIPTMIHTIDRESRRLHHPNVYYGRRVHELPREPKCPTLENLSESFPK